MKDEKQIKKELENQKELLKTVKSKEEKIQYEYIVNTLKWVLNYESEG